MNIKTNAATWKGLPPKSAAPAKITPTKCRVLRAMLNQRRPGKSRLRNWGGSIADFISNDRALYDIWHSVLQNRWYPDAHDCAHRLARGISDSTSGTAKECRRMIAYRKRSAKACAAGVAFGKKSGASSRLEAPSRGLELPSLEEQNCAQGDGVDLGRWRAATLDLFVHQFAG